MTPTSIETPRLLLRPFREEDLDRLAVICADAEVMRFIGNGHVLNRAATWRALAMYLGHWELRGYGLWAAIEKRTGELIGRAGLWNPEGWPGLEIGWLLDRARWGQGLATEAGCASLDYAFEAIGADQVISVIHPANAASIRVAEKIGETYDASMVIDGIEVSIYAIERAGWTKTRKGL